MDLAHSAKTINKEKFRSFGVACLLIASKSEESEHVPKLKELQEYAEGKIEDFELEVLNLIN